MTLPCQSCDKGEQIDQILRNQAETLKLLRELSRAFPLNEFSEPDIEGHRRHHVGLIRKDAQYDEAKSRAMSKVSTAGITGALTLILIAVWDYIKGQLR
jgi:hypothetical protein